MATAVSRTTTLCSTVPLLVPCIEPHSGTTFELVGSGGVAVLVIAGCLVVADRLPLLTAPLRAVGALALSVYTAQIVALRALTEVDPAAAQGVGAWLLFVLSAFSYMVDFFHLQGILRWTLILLFMMLKAGLIVAVFMHMAWERLALAYAILLPPVLVLVFVAIMVFESEYTHLIRVVFFGSPT